MILLIRHGQTTTNAQNLLVGRSDPPLTELGQRQARALRPLLDGVEEVWTSPLQRARSTAAPTCRPRSPKLAPVGFLLRKLLRMIQLRRERRRRYGR